MPQHSIVAAQIATPQQQQQAANTLRLLGPRLPIEVGAPDALVKALAAQGKPVPTPHVGFALLDTGASNTSVDDAVAQSLGLQQVNSIPVQTPGGTVQANVYAAKISFPGTQLPPIQFIEVLGSTLATQGLLALIGRDFFVNKTLHYDGCLSVVTLSW